jgi:hypothetical protein
MGEGGGAVVGLYCSEWGGEGGGRRMKWLRLVIGEEGRRRETCESV